jgi:hypothetical protein
VFELARAVGKTAGFTALEEQTDSQTDDGTQANDPQRNTNAPSGRRVAHCQQPLRIEGHRESALDGPRCRRFALPG